MRNNNKDIYRLFDSLQNTLLKMMKGAQVESKFKYMLGKSNHPKTIRSNRNTFNSDLEFI